MSNFTKFVSTDRQGHIQTGQYCHLTSTISIRRDTNPDSKVGQYGLRETEEVEKLITTVASFDSRSADSDIEKQKQLFDLLSHHSASVHLTSGPGTLITSTLN